MNADSEFNSQAGGGPTQLHSASLAAGFGAPDHELLSVLETPSASVSIKVP